MITTQGQYYYLSICFDAFLVTKLDEEVATFFAIFWTAVVIMHACMFEVESLKISSILFICFQ